jgi:hypothetical protein
MSLTYWFQLQPKFYPKNLTHYLACYWCKTNSVLIPLWRTELIKLGRQFTSSVENHVHEFLHQSSSSTNMRVIGSLVQWGALQLLLDSNIMGSWTLVRWSTLESLISSLLCCSPQPSYVVPDLASFPDAHHKLVWSPEIISQNLYP